MNAASPRGTILLLLIFLFLSGCSAMPDWVGADNEKKLPGDRISVLEYKTRLHANSNLADMEVTFPERVTNDTWLLQDIAPTEHPALPSVLKDTMQISAGKGAGSGFRITSHPLVEGERVYLIDGEGTVSSRNATKPKEILWKKNINIHSEPSGTFGFGNSKKEFLGGNIGMADGILFVTTGFGDIMALDAASGEEKWRRSVKIPIKSAPTAGNGRVFFITASNQLYALDAATGRTLWTHFGIEESTSLMGAASPVLMEEEGIILAPYSSGELYALKADSGHVVWSEALGSDRLRSTSRALNDIDATPVVRGNAVFAVAHDGALVAIDRLSGKRIWEQDISTIKTPWAGGYFMYVLTGNDELVCLYLPDGRIKWVSRLPSHTEPGLLALKEKGERITWNSPVLAGGRLLITGSGGVMVSVSPENGKGAQRISIPDDVFLPPVVAHNTVYIYSNDAKLTVIR